MLPGLIYSITPLLVGTLIPVDLCSPAAASEQSSRKLAPACPELLTQTNDLFIKDIPERLQSNMTDGEYFKNNV